MVNHSSLNIKSARVLTGAWFAALVLFASVSFADPVLYTDDTFPAAAITIGTDGVEFQITGTPTYSKTMSGSGSLYKTETGTLALSNGGSSFTGNVIINGGAIKISAARSDTNSALGAVKSGRTINIDSGAELILNNQDIFTTAHNANPIFFVVDGGTISNDGAYYNYLTNVTLKNGSEIKATNGNAKWKAYKFHNLTVERSDREDRSPVTITATAGQTNATIAFGDISNTIKAGTSSSTVNVGEITSADGSVDDKSDLIISAVIANPLYDSKPYSNATQIVKTGAGTMELTAANTISGKTTISAGKIKLTGAGTLGTGAVVNNATLEFAHTSDITSSNAISGSGVLIKSGTGTLTLSNGGSSYTGNVFLDGGKISVTGKHSGSNSALGKVQSGRTINVNRGTELIFANQDVFTDAHTNNPVAIVVDGGKISNSGTNYNFLQTVTLKNGAVFHAADGNETWEAYKIHNLNVVSNTNGSAATAATITGANNDHAVFSFGPKSSDVGKSPSTIYVENITNNANSDLIISAKIVDPTTVNTGVKTPGEIVKTGAGTLELKNVNSSYSGNLTISAGTVKVTAGSNGDNRVNSALGASNVAGRTVTINSGAVLELAAQDVMCDTHTDTKLTFVVDGGQIKNSGANFNFLQNVTLKNGGNIYAANGNKTWEAYKIQNLRVERSGDAAASAVSLTAASGDHNVFTFGAISSKITTTPVSIYVEDITSANGASDNVTDLLISAKIVNANIDGKTKKAAPIVKSGAGTLELKNTGNTYSGNLTIDEGTVKVTAGSASNGRTASALGASDVAGRLITVNNGAVLELAAGNVIVNAHTSSKLAIVVDGGQILNNSGYNFLQNLTLKDGAQVYATGGADDWKSLKFHNLSIVRKSAGAADSPVVISSDLTNPNATIAFGDISSVIMGGDNNSVSTVKVEEITSANPSVNDNVSDLVISAIITDPLHTTTGRLSNATQIIKAGAGTMELTAANTMTGMTTISGGTLKLTGDGTLGTGAVIVNENGTLEIAYEDPSKSVNFSSVTMAEGSSFKVTSGKVTFGTDDAALNNLSGGYLDENGQVPNPVPATLTVDGKLTLNNDQTTTYIGSIKAGTIEKTGDGTLKIYTGAAGLVDTQSLVVSSGRLDLKGFMAGSVTIEDAVFSPGNSIGEATFNDDFILGSATSMLLMEIGGENADQNDALFAGGELQFNDGLIYLELSEGSTLKGGDTFVAVLSGSNSGNNGFGDDLLSHVRSYYFKDLEYIQLDDSYGEKYKNKFAIRGTLNPNAVPEPSTWALLALGAAGLLYWRKRK